jgi:hypothetical protein
LDEVVVDQVEETSHYMTKQCKEDDILKYFVDEQRVESLQGVSLDVAVELINLNHLHEHHEVERSLIVGPTI